MDFLVENKRAAAEETIDMFLNNITTFVEGWIEDTGKVAKLSAMHLVPVDALKKLSELGTLMTSLTSLMGGAVAAPGTTTIALTEQEFANAVTGYLSVPDKLEARAIYLAGLIGALILRATLNWEADKKAALLNNVTDSFRKGSAETSAKDSDNFNFDMRSIV